MATVAFARRADCVTVLKAGRIQHNQVTPNSIDSALWAEVEIEDRADTDDEYDNALAVFDIEGKDTTEKRVVRVSSKAEADESSNIRSMGDKTLYIMYASPLDCPSAPFGCSCQFSTWLGR